MLVLVDPSALLLVTVADEGDATRVFTVISCRYVSAHGADGSANVGVELLYDPNHAAPLQPYYLQSEHAQTLLIPPDALLEIRPYRTLARGA